MQNEQFDQQSLLPLKATLQMGRYRVDRYLSSGGFGNTYVITNLQFEEQFAMKEFFMKGINERSDDNTTISVSNKTNRPQFEQQREKFKKEARRLRKLHNRHIVQVHDLFEENGTAYYVMDYVDGESLSTRLKRTKKPLGEQEALSVLTQALDALETVHEQGIWHLDLKPANIMVDKSGNAVLIDFGASKQMSISEGYTNTATAMCYTLGYAPPEQIDQNMELIGPWTDLYALGATLYNILTCNQPPFVSAMFNTKTFSFPKPVSDKTAYLIRWMMNPNREKRPQSVEEVRRFLDKPFPKEDVVEEVPDTDDELTQMPDAPKAKKQSGGSGVKKWLPLAAIGAVLCIGMVVFALIDRPDHVAVENQNASPLSSAKPQKSSKEAIIERLIANMVYVEGGTFTMGATSEQGSDAESDEKPAHQVTVSSFSIGKYEVTQEEWEAVMGSNPSNFKGAKRPVESVSCYDCYQFIRQLNAMTGMHFRMLTEAEWEYAARGGKKSIGYEYAGGDNLDRVAWYDENSGNATHDVGQKSPNELGLYDMSGNVYEWCQDWYGGYSSGIQSNPSGPSSGSDRVFRGGSWLESAWCCRVSNRGYESPDDGRFNLGLRLAL